jgi:DNA-3-methyladenine glycosylase II
MIKDPQTFLLEKDPILAKIITQTPSFKKTDWQQDVYLALLESIVSQQISVKAADAIFIKFRALFPDNYPDATLLMNKMEEELRAAGLSFQKIGYLRNVAVFHIERGIYFEQFQKLTDEEIVQYLIPIKGVGRWTVEMLLMFVLDRPDVFPIDDLVIRQKMIRAYQVTNELKGRELYKTLHEIAEKWRPHRSTACRYLWRWKPE